MNKINTYDICKWYLSPGDKCWYINSRGSIIHAIVYQRDIWQKDQENNPHFLKRYWIEPSNVHWWHKLSDLIRGYMHRKLRIKGSWSPNWRYPGHSVELGEEIFLTKEEAEINGQDY